MDKQYLTGQGPAGNQYFKEQQVLKQTLKPQKQQQFSVEPPTLTAQYNLLPSQKLGSANLGQGQLLNLKKEQMFEDLKQKSRQNTLKIEEEVLPQQQAQTIGFKANIKSLDQKPLDIE